jgi:ferredoxin/flavodoxin---NADP+ reductase
MHRIVRRTVLAEDIVRLDVEAPRIAEKRKAGQFVIVRAAQDGERMPLTICDADPAEGTIALIIQAVGASSHQLCALEEGQDIPDLCGPLGRPTEVKKFGTVVCVGGGLGTAPLYPIVKALHEAGNRIVSIVGARSENLLILVDEMRAISDELLLASDDGTIGHKGFVSEVLADVIAREKVDACVAIGPVMMMRACAEVTREPGIHTLVSLNPIMVDGTGMCGGCRVSVGGKTRFACVDGPEFDGHEVDYLELAARLRAYQPFESEQHKQAHEADPDGCKLTPALNDTRSS